MGRKKADPDWVVILPNWVGDFIMAFASLDVHFGSFVLCGKKSFFELVRGRYPRSLWVEKEQGFSGFFLTLFRLMKTTATGAVLLPNSFGSAVVTTLSGMRKVVGLPTDFRWWLLTKRVSIENLKDLHQAEVYRRIVISTGFSVKGDLRSRIYLAKEDIKWALEFLRREKIDPEKTVIVHPGASKPYRRWPKDRFRIVVRYIVDRGYKVLLIGSRGESEVCNFIGSGMKGVYNVSLLDLPLGRLAALITLGGSVFLGNDSGPIHIASTSIRSIVGIYGSTNPKKTGPLVSEGAKFIPVTKMYPCSPCRERFFKDCEPVNGLPPCINAIKVEDVIEALDEVIL